MLKSKPIMKSLLNKLVLGLLLIASVGCSSITDKNMAPESDSFQIHFGKIDFDLGHSFESSWPLLKDWYTTGPTFIVGIDDIEKYYWDRHVLMLTPTASQNFVSEFGDYPGPNLAFVVTVNSEPVYGGVFMAPFSAMGKWFPVIYIGASDEKVAFIIRPTHDATNNYKPSDDWRGINDSRIEDILSKAGKISYLPLPPMTPVP